MAKDAGCSEDLEEKFFPGRLFVIFPSPGDDAILRAHAPARPLQRGHHGVDFVRRNGEGPYRFPQIIEGNARLFLGKQPLDDARELRPKKRGGTRAQSVKGMLS